ncbi:hypothetical protein ABZ806_22670 [Spirillospora sp. NPDC047418]
MLSTGALEPLPEDQLSAVLAHERAHLAGRRDLAINLAVAFGRAFPAFSHLTTPCPVPDVSPAASALCLRRCRWHSPPTRPSRLSLNATATSRCSGATRTEPGVATELVAIGPPRPPAGEAVGEAAKGRPRHPRGG